jgi:DNA-binding NarL/FixJ family response regulator
MSPRFVRPLPNLDDRPGRVLICEDSNDLRALLVSRLAKQRAVEVVGDVADGGAALEAVKRLRPDALLLDLMIDDTDPSEMLHALAALEPRPLVIVFSGLAPSALSQESRATIDLYLDKTTPLRAVAELVAEAVSARRSGERL